MRTYRGKMEGSQRQRRSTRNLQLIRDLCSERARLIEEVKQLSATVEVYREVLRRTESGPFVQEPRVDASIS